METTKLEVIDIKPTQQTQQHIEVNADNDTNSDFLGELLYDGILIGVPVLIALIIYGIKKCLNKFGLLTKKINDVLDKAQVKISDSATKAGTKFVDKKFKVNKNSSRSQIVKEIGAKVGETVNSNLKVELNESPKKDKEDIEKPKE